jgi:hypothetical protein
MYYFLNNVFLLLKKCDVIDAKRRYVEFNLYYFFLRFLYAAKKDERQVRFLFLYMNKDYIHNLV